MARSPSILSALTHVGGPWNILEARCKWVCNVYESDTQILTECGPTTLNVRLVSGKRKSSCLTVVALILKDLR